MTAKSPSVAGLSHTARDVAPASAARRAVARVLQIEADGLLALLGTLDDSIEQALECLAGATGRVVVTGIGKSGHVARKVAATMASTGVRSG